MADRRRQRPTHEPAWEGLFTSSRLSGGPDDPATITFQSTWDGVADFDVTPPSIGVTSSTIRKPARPKGPYTLRLVISLTDTGGGPVSYTLQVLDSRKPFGVLGYKQGLSTTGAVTRDLRFTAQRRTRVARIQIDDAADQN